MLIQSYTAYVSILLGNYILIKFINTDKHNIVTGNYILIQFINSTGKHNIVTGN
jgi:hypothetical protein